VTNTLREKPDLLKPENQGSNEIHHFMQEWGDRPTLNNLRLAERWNNSELHLLLCFTHGDGKQYIASLQRENILDRSDKNDPSLVFGNPAGKIPFRELTWRDTVRGHIGGSGNEQSMLIDIVKQVENPEKLSVPASVWLDSIDGIYSVLPHALYFSGRFGLVFRGCLSNWEVNSGSGWVALAAPYGNEMVSNMVESTPEVLQCVSGDDRNTLRNLTAAIQPIDALRNIEIVLETDSIGLRLKKGTPFGFQIEDVLLGPLYL